MKKLERVLDSFGDPRSITKHNKATIKGVPGIATRSKTKPFLSNPKKLARLHRRVRPVPFVLRAPTDRHHTLSQVIDALLLRGFSEGFALCVQRSGIDGVRKAIQRS